MLGVPAAAAAPAARRMASAAATAAADVALRRMLPTDLPQCAAMEQAGYPAALWEGELGYQKWMAASPAGCMVAEATDSRAVVGLVVCVPAKHADCPFDLAQGGAASEAAAEPDTLYLHDISVLPAFRGRGVSKLLLDRIEEMAWELQVPTITLTAVCGAWDYWARLGWREEARMSTAHQKLPREAAERLLHYPPESGDAQLMIRTLKPRL
eukprot:SAG31_NODE_7055_length_1802_cov_1.672343_1_plen_211_part_00